MNVKEYRVEVRVVPRQGILDPQGKAIVGALPRLGFTSFSSSASHQRSWLTSPAVGVRCRRFLPVGLKWNRFTALVM